LLAFLAGHATPSAGGTATLLRGLGGGPGLRHMGGMSRPGLAALTGLVGFLLYVGAVVALADHVLPLHWLVQLVYFVVAGIAWVWPAKALMVWGAGGRR
jgi:hypothetical protein